MMQETNLDHKRAIIFSTSVRFSSSTHSLKDEAIQRIVEQILVSSATGLTIRQIQDKASELVQDFFINRNDLEQALKQVSDERKNSIGDVAVETVYTLSASRTEEVKHTQQNAEERLNRVVKLIFENAPLPFVEYRDVFLYALSLIFYELGNNNASLLLTNSNIDLPTLREAAQKSCKKYSKISFAEIEQGLTRFFERDDPEFSEIKWNLAQNYYVCLALGIAQANTLLSKEILDKSVLYLDTNIAIALLEPVHPLHKGVMTLFQVCHHLNVELVIASISINELQRWIQYQETQLKNGILEQIPVP